MTQTSTLSAPKLPKLAKKHDYRIMLGIPSLGHYHCEMALSLISCSRDHTIDVQRASSNWDNFSILWALALNASEAGQITHFAMLHDDIIPAAYWIDTLVDEMERRKLSLLSVPIPIKDHNGIVSSGIGQSAEPCKIWRRLTLWELYHTSLSETFDMADIFRCIPGKWPEGDNKPYICHNNGCWVADLRDPRFHQVGPDGNAAVYFQFPKRMQRTEAKDQQGEPVTRWAVSGESEDWFFSRRLMETGILNTAMTTKVKLGHDGGSIRWTNDDGWGAMQHDEATKSNWQLDSMKNEEDKSKG